MVTQENDSLKVRLRELSEANLKLTSSESRIAILAQEIERLNGSLKTKADEMTVREKKIL